MEREEMKMNVGKGRREKVREGMGEGMVMDEETRGMDKRKHSRKVNGWGHERRVEGEERRVDDRSWRVRESMREGTNMDGRAW